MDYVGVNIIEEDISIIVFIDKISYKFWYMGKVDLYLFVEGLCWKNGGNVIIGRLSGIR